MLRFKQNYGSSPSWSLLFAFTVAQAKTNVDWQPLPFCRCVVPCCLLVEQRGWAKGLNNGNPWPCLWPTPTRRGRLQTPEGSRLFWVVLAESPDSCSCLVVKHNSGRKVVYELCCFVHDQGSNRGRSKVRVVLQKSWNLCFKAGRFIIQPLTFEQLRIRRSFPWGGSCFNRWFTLCYFMKRV